MDQQLLAANSSRSRSLSTPHPDIPDAHNSQGNKTSNEQQSAQGCGWPIGDENPKDEGEQSPEAQGVLKLMLGPTGRQP